MALSQAMAPKTKANGVGLNAEQKKDLKIAVLLGERLLRAGGFDVIQKAMKSSKDPGQVIGQFLLQLGQQMFEKMPSNIKLSPRILLCPGGWVEQISDFIQEKLNVPKDVMDKAEIYIASTSSQMANAKRQQGQGNINGIPAPPSPQPGGPQGPPQGGPPMPPQGGLAQQMGGR